MGVAFIPLFIFNHPGRAHHGKVCTILGKEKLGQYASQFNFIGGSNRGHSVEELKSYTDINFEVLKNEVFEELGLCLSKPLLNKCTILNKYKNGTAFYVCKINGIHISKWREMMKVREQIPGLDWKYQELSELKYFLVEDLETNPLVSPYVKHYVQLIRAAVNKMCSVDAVHFNTFKMNCTHCTKIPAMV